jgi:predicted phosphate transport protein (TIGR00153 family)
MALFNFLPKEEQYFALFSQMTSYIFDAARALTEMLSDKRGNYEEHSRRIKAIEHQCDELAHKVSTRLNKSFITPFDREDIYLRSSALDDIVDLIDDAARAMVMYDVHESTDHAAALADVLQRMSVELHDIVTRLERPDGIAPRLVTIHTLENEGDELYHRAIKELFHNATDPLYVMKWNSIYEKLEAAIDRCENVANIIESVIIKHT